MSIPNARLSLGHVLSHLSHLRIIFGDLRPLSPFEGGEHQADNQKPDAGCDPQVDVGH